MVSTLKKIQFALIAAIAVPIAALFLLVGFTGDEWGPLAGVTVATGVLGGVGVQVSDEFLTTRQEGVALGAFAAVMFGFVLAHSYMQGEPVETDTILAFAAGLTVAAWLYWRPTLAGGRGDD